MGVGETRSSDPDIRVPQNAFWGVKNGKNGDQTSVKPLLEMFKADAALQMHLTDATVKIGKLMDAGPSKSKLKTNHIGA